MRRKKKGGGESTDVVEESNDLSVLLALRLFPLTCVPVLSRERVPEPERALIGRELVPDDAHARQARDLRRRRVNLDFAKVGAEVALLCGREILIAEKDDRALCDQESELYQPKRRSVREEHT